MSTIRRTKQGGSVLTFVIIGVILAAGLAGAIYWVKQRGEQARQEQVNIAYEQQKKAEESDKTKEIADKSETSTSSTDSENEGSTAAVTTVTEATSNQSEMPITGPETTITEVLGVCLLTMAITSYAMSRRDSLLIK